MGKTRTETRGPGQKRVQVALNMLHTPRFLWTLEEEEQRRGVEERSSTVLQRRNQCRRTHQRHNVVGEGGVACKSSENEQTKRASFADTFRLESSCSVAVQCVGAPRKNPSETHCSMNSGVQFGLEETRDSQGEAPSCTNDVIMDQRRLQGQEPREERDQRGSAPRGVHAISAYENIVQRPAVSAHATARTVTSASSHSNMVTCRSLICRPTVTVYESQSSCESDHNHRGETGRRENFWGQEGEARASRRLAVTTSVKG